jgi:tetratricopeptide (TPR) repeat protein
MKSTFKVIPQLVFVMLLTITSSTIASTNDSTEPARILEALKLYSKAASIEYGSTQQMELLNRSESILLDVIEKNPASLDAHRKLMGVYLQMRDYLKGIQVMQNAISLSPEDPKLFMALAILYDHQGAYEYALPILDEALALDPDQPLARDYKASIQRKIEMRNMAMESSTPPHELDGLHSR